MEAGAGLLVDRAGIRGLFLRFQFRPSSDTAVSGIALRAVPHETNRNANPDDKGGFPFHLTAWIGKYPACSNREGEATGTLWWSPDSRAQPPLDPDHLAEVKPIGDWNDMEIEMRGLHLRIAVNGSLVQDVKLNQTRPEKFPAPGLNRYSGRIGFLKRTGEVRFRKIEIRELTVSRVKGTRAKSPATKAFKTITNSLGMKLNLIPPGEFLMGSPEADKVAERKRSPPPRTDHQALLPGEYEVTQGQYQAVMSENPSWFKEWDDLPVETILWLDAIKFCNKLSERESRNPYYRIEGDPGYQCCRRRWLPSAHGGGVGVCRLRGQPDGLPVWRRCRVRLAEHAWYNKNAEQRTHPVGRKQPNAWGFHDMLGNVWEWCGDRHDAEYYASSPVNDPPGPTKGSYRLIRGGGWYYDQRASRPADRWGFSMAKNRFSSLGFRVARADSGSDVASRPPVPSRKPPISAVPKPPETVTNTLGMKLALIPAGEFMMGSPADDKDARDWEKPQHRVRITRPFYLGVHEVKQAEYLSVMGVNPSVFSAKGQGQDRVVGRSTAHYPVENVSWLDAVRFCNTLSEKESPQAVLPDRR